VGVAPASLPPTPSSLGENDKLEPGNQDPSDSGGPLTALIQYELPWTDTLPIIISSRSRTLGPAPAWQRFTVTISQPTTQTRQTNVMACSISMPPSTHHHIICAHHSNRNHRRIDISHLHSFPRRAPPAPSAPCHHHAKRHSTSQEFAQHRRALQHLQLGSPKSPSHMRRATHTTSLVDSPHHRIEPSSMPEPSRQTTRHSTGSRQAAACHRSKR